MAAQKSYRISGHESFPCRYAWLPKAVRGIRENQRLFSNNFEDDAMVALGLGKNMVRSVRFWSQVTGLVTVAPKGAGHHVTAFGAAMLGERGLDPFLEDIRTLWLLHWKLSTNGENPLLAWDYLLNRWQEPELAPGAVVKALQKEAALCAADLSPVTVEQHFEVFLHTYIPTRGRKGEVREDNLDSPLVELELIVKRGDRAIDRATGKREVVYDFRREDKPDITPQLFAYCLNEFWQQRHLHEETVALREVTHGHGSPGQIFKLPEENIRARVEALGAQTDGYFGYIDSANLQQIRREGERTETEMLKQIYAEEGVYA